ncbi:MAG TPA: immunoglobulin domain-containing protein [Verrucomicrobiae bacterium]|nr:immunoglobulin domain-containing protein [Verrucomicrobiae bacterium]
MKTTRWMNFCQFVQRTRRALDVPTMLQARTGLGVGLMLLAIGAGAAPTITVQPVGGQAATNESFAMSVQATGTATVTYQWTRNGGDLSAATNATLLLTNLTTSQAGTYAVRVTDSGTTVTSSNAFLVIRSQPRLLTTGVISGGGQAQVEIQLRANGREHAVSFSLGYLTNVLANPVFTPTYPGAGATVDATAASNGLVGVTWQLPAGVMLTNGPVSLGYFTFDFTGGNNPFAGGLYFTNAPTDLAATDTNGLDLVLPAAVLPSAEVLGTPTLNRQSGLFEQSVMLGNGGPVLLTNAQLLVYGLGNDSLSNAITLFNAQRYASQDWNADGAFEPVPFVQVSSLTNGETRLLTLEYYVGDHITIPAPGVLTLASNAWTFVPPAGNPLAVTRALYTNGVFLIEFNTLTNRHYFIQYADTPADLMDSATVQTAFPAVTGTGSRMQWIDNGPPKTASPPTNGSRFYRVLLQGQ